MLPINRVLSKPRLVWKPALQLSAPPKAPPSDDPDCWSKMAAAKRTERPICIYGSIEAIVCIFPSIAECFWRGKEVARILFYKTRIISGEICYRARNDCFSRAGGRPPQTDCAKFF